MSDVKTEFLFEYWASIGDSYDVGNTPGGGRRVVNVTGGKFEGPKLKGDILPGGGDWVISRADGASDLDVRITLRTDDGEIVYMHYRGIIYSTPEVRERRSRGETVDPSEIYFRTAPYFHTSSDKYDWLNRTVSVGVGWGTPGRVNYRVYAIL